MPFGLPCDFVDLCMATFRVVCETFQFAHRNHLKTSKQKRFCVHSIYGKEFYFQKAVINPLPNDLILKKIKEENHKQEIKWKENAEQERAIFAAYARCPTPN